MGPSTYSSTSSIPPEAGLAAFGIFAGMLVFFLFVILAVYIFYAICLMKIANKTNTPNAWLAWIPVANLILMLQIAKKPLWWIILFIIPLVNIVISILVWMGISKEVGKPDWLGILIIIPIANLVIPAYLAFSQQETPAATV